MEAAHSRRRILHAHGDSTGKELVRVLITKIKTLPKVQRLPFSATFDLIIDEGTCKGAYVLTGSELAVVSSKATVLATGGAGQIFSRTTNPAVATGDGIALAYRAGAVLEDMEFVQFHPTALFAPAAPQFLLSEAMRGEGALLRNIHKESFMKLYHPDAELAPRDVVSRAIVSEMARTASSNVYLDLTHRDAEFIKNRFPRIYATCLKYDVDITKDLIPVSPAAHYMIGGVRTNLDGATSIDGLFAAGEVACTGVHGANRLASNSLLEGLVYGFRAGVAAAPYSAEERRSGSAAAPAASPSELKGMEEIRAALRRIMWEKVGIIRNGASLTDAYEKLLEWRSILEMDFSSRTEYELKNMLTVALLITEAALRRKGSVGAHYRSDFPELGEDWQKHISLARPASFEATTEGVLHKGKAGAA
jgi:L-aspartate oxidase